MSDNMRLWEAWKTPPNEKGVLKPIRAGRLKGMTDISPVWRLRALTEQLGPCGTGWKYEIVQLWTEQGPDGQVAAFARVDLYITSGGPEGTNQWSAPIPGVGGASLVALEKKGLHFSDEAYKMAVTDALSVACKSLGIAASVYMNQMDGKYQGDRGQGTGDGSPRQSTSRTPEAPAPELEPSQAAAKVEELLMRMKGKVEVEFGQVATDASLKGQVISEILEETLGIGVTSWDEAAKLKPQHIFTSLKEKFVDALTAGTQRYVTEAASQRKKDAQDSPASEVAG